MKQEKERFTRWAFRCPHCGSKSHAHGEIDTEVLLYQCRNVYCGLVWEMQAEDEQSRQPVSTPYLCPKCHSKMNTVTHIKYRQSIVKKYMRCTNPCCLSQRRLFVDYKQSLNAPGKYATDTHGQYGIWLTP